LRDPESLAVPCADFGGTARHSDADDKAPPSAVTQTIDPHLGLSSIESIGQRKQLPYSAKQPSGLLNAERIVFDTAWYRAIFCVR
jgi:hypothetical protein